MKKIILATLFIGMIYGCQKPTVKSKRTNIVIEFGSDPLEVVTIEGCEYFRTETAHNFFTLTHKGNCKNQIHEGGDK